MSRLDELIAELCPDGVEYVKLGEVCIFKRGTSITKKDITNGNIPVIAGGQKPAYYCNQANRFNETITVSSSGANAGYVSYWDKPIFVSDAFSVEPNERLIIKYLYYFLKNKQHQIYSTKRGGGVPHVYGSDLAPFSIPVPPLPVQQEIVRILDNFTALEAELEAELEARKKQYEYYRDLLLTFDSERSTTIKWLTLGGVCKSVSSGGTPLKSHTEYYGGNIPWLRTQEVKFADILETENTITQLGLDNSSAKWIPANCVIVAISGATAARCAINKIPLTTNQHCCNLEINGSLALYRYVYYWVSSQYEQLKSLGQGARNDLNVGIITQYPIPIPPLIEQERIIVILDRFDALVNDITQGLPAEIEARRKQYEYYRDKLLTFKEAASS